MDDKDINIDLSNIDMMLAKLANKMENGVQLDLDYDYSSMGQAATISQAASPYTWPYITPNSGTYTLTTGSGTGNITPGLTFSDTWALPEQALHVRGDAKFEGDIKLKGKSLSDTLDKIEQRLAILRPNKELEDKWEKLKELGDMYRALEKDILEKEQIWNTLKK